jgi:hypothetical protein
MSENHSQMQDRICRKHLPCEELVADRQAPVLFENLGLLPSPVARVEGQIQEQRLSGSTRLMKILVQRPFENSRY